jgi:hypothetical protein
MEPLILSQNWSTNVRFLFVHLPGFGEIRSGEDVFDDNKGVKYSPTRNAFYPIGREDPGR